MNFVDVVRTKTPSEVRTRVITGAVISGQMAVLAYDVKTTGEELREALSKRLRLPLERLEVRDSAGAEISGARHLDLSAPGVISVNVRPERGSLRMPSGREVIAREGPPTRYGVRVLLHPSAEGLGWLDTEIAALSRRVHTERNNMWLLYIVLDGAQVGALDASFPAHLRGRVKLVIFRTTGAAPSLDWRRMGQFEGEPLVFTVPHVNPYAWDDARDPEVAALQRFVATTPSKIPVAVRLVDFGDRVVGERRLLGVSTRATLTQLAEYCEEHGFFPAHWNRLSADSSLFAGEEGDRLEMGATVSDLLTEEKSFFGVDGIPVVNFRHQAEAVGSGMCHMAHESTVHGHPVTDRQRRYFFWKCHEQHR